MLVESNRNTNSIFEEVFQYQLTICVTILKHLFLEDTGDMDVQSVYYKCNLLKLWE